MNEQPKAPRDAAAAPRPEGGARRDAPGVALVCLAGMAATVVFVSWPEIDLNAARLFVDESHRFFLERHPLPRLFNTLIEVLAVVLIVSSLGGLAYTGFGRRTLAGHGPRAYAFVLASVAIGPGLIANTLFKNGWGRARPRQIIEFGGTADFTPALAFADQCARNCSFVAGDASLAFATLAVALLAPAATRARWVAVAVLFGGFIGFIRIIQGAHFLSDVVFAGIFVSLTVLVLKGMILEGRWGGAAVERLLALLVRPLSGAGTPLAGTAGGREFWLRMLPGLKEFGVTAGAPPSQHGPSQHGPSQHGPSQHGPSQHGPSRHGKDEADGSRPAPPAHSTSMGIFK
jgi:lipid A 4'-phosphatase